MYALWLLRQVFVIEDAKSLDIYLRRYFSFFNNDRSDRLNANSRSNVDYLS